MYNKLSDMAQMFIKLGAWVVLFVAFHGFTHAGVTTTGVVAALITMVVLYAEFILKRS